MTTPSFNDYNIFRMAAHRSGTLRDIPLSAFSQSIGPSSDDSASLVNLPFSFVFEGESYNQINVTTNGVVQLCSGTTMTSQGIFGALTGSNQASFVSSQAWQFPVLGPWWGDARTADSVHRGGVYVHSRSLGFGSHQEVIVRWMNYGYWNETSGSCHFLSYEVALNTMGGISFNYAPMIQIGSPTNVQAHIIAVGMKTRVGTTNRSKFISGSLAAPLGPRNYWPMKYNEEVSFLITPPRQPLPIKAQTVRVKVTR